MHPQSKTEHQPCTTSVLVQLIHFIFLCLVSFNRRASPTGQHNNLTRGRDIEMVGEYKHVSLQVMTVDSVAVARLNVNKQFPSNISQLGNK